MHDRERQSLIPLAFVRTMGRKRERLNGMNDMECMKVHVSKALTVKVVAQDARALGQA